MVFPYIDIGTSEALRIIAAIVIPVLSLWFVVRSFKKSHNINKRLLEIEEERRSKEEAASLTASFHYDGKVRKLRIENKRKGEARNIKVFLDSKPLDKEHPLWYNNQSEITTILSGHTHRDYTLYLKPSAVPQIAEIRWDDDAKKNNAYKGPLPI